MARRACFTQPFIQDYQFLPAAMRLAVDAAVARLLDNPRHPSLRAKKMQPKEVGIFEARISRTLRMTYQVDGQTMTFRRVGTHDILRKP